jgi:pimeloyl-ACP methyl ester carboxylesterase
LAREAIGVLDALGVEEPAHVLGISMGGRIAQWVALDHPGRVRGLVLASTGPGQYKDGFEPPRGIPLHVAEGLIEKGYDAYMRDHLGSAVFFPPQVAAARPDLIEWARAAFFEHRMPLGSYLRHTLARQRHQTYERLGEIKAPTLILCGEHDTAVLSTGNHVEASQAMAGHIPHVELRVVKGAAHSLFWQAPEETNAVVLDFLRRH